MGELKLRVKIKNHPMPYDFVTVDMGNSVVAIVDPDRGTQKSFEWSEIEKFLRFTGKHDALKRELWEGDIVNFLAGDFDVFASSGIISWDYDDLGFYIQTNSNICPYVKPWHVKKIEKIGNIYQNPELMEGK